VTLERIVGWMRSAPWRARCVVGLAAGLAASLGSVSVASADLSGTDLSIYAGTGQFGAPTPGLATDSQLYFPSSVAVDPSSGDLYIADSENNEIERVTPGGVLSIVAGTGSAGLPTPGPATRSRLSYPDGVAVDPDTGDLYIADSLNSRIEQVTPGGILSIIAGDGGHGPSKPGPATHSDLGFPGEVAVEPSTGDLYIADPGNSEIEQVTPGGILSIIAGTGLQGKPTPGEATKSRLTAPEGVAVNSSTGDLYIADTENSEIEQVTPDGVLSIIAGTGEEDPAIPGPAASSPLDQPTGVAVDPTTGDTYIADSENREIEQIAPDGTLSIVAGTTGRGAPTPGPATQSRLSDPWGVAVDSSTDDLYIADLSNEVIERVGAPPPADVAFTFPADDPTTEPDGHTFTETVTVNNDGPNATPNVSAMFVNLPPKGSGLTATNLDGGELMRRQLSWEIPVLEPGDTVTHTITFKVAKHASGQVQLTGFAAVPSNDPNPGNNQDAITLTLGPGS
jgi:DNA-binding beta-propeller fold protein YncE